MTFTLAQAEAQLAEAKIALARLRLTATDTTGSTLTAQQNRVDDLRESVEQESLRSTVGTYHGHIAEGQRLQKEADLLAAEVPKHRQALFDRTLLGVQPHHIHAATDFSIGDGILRSEREVESAEDLYRHSMERHSLLSSMARRERDAARLWLECHPDLLDLIPTADLIEDAPHWPETSYNGVERFSPRLRSYIDARRGNG